MFSCLMKPAGLLTQMRRSPTGTVVEIEGITFEFGNVASLVRETPNATDLSLKEWPFEERPSHLYHLDNISADRKRTLERLHDLPGGSLAGRSSRADLLIRMESGRPVLVSVKDDSRTAKLGQVSSSTAYGRAELVGGLSRTTLPSDLIPDDVTHTQTRLSKRRFEKLGLQDRQFAYFKKQFPKQWDALVADALRDAVAQTAELAAVMASDRESFVSFLCEVIAGPSATSTEFFLLIGNELINFKQLLARVRTTDLTVAGQIYETTKKSSYLVWVQMNGSNYCLTKIEPSFEGAKPTVEQTKGVVFHFQQHPAEGNHYKRLLLDLIQ